MWLRQCSILLLILLSGCEKYYLSVKRESVDRSKLASTFVGSPDPRQKNPPTGEELLLEWRLPRTALKQELTLVLKLIYKNYSEETIRYPVDRRRGVIIFALLDEKYRQTEGFLTYKADIITPDGTPLKEWKQQLWVDLITLEDIDLDESPSEDNADTKD
ncbi:MAG: hypothetical protein K1060chlam2_01547 [Chlamydiae bacterium]|nr:hypothetical protein [Chlamydiota bacterium]